MTTTEVMRSAGKRKPVYVLPRKKHAFACSLRTQQCIDITRVRHHHRPPWEAGNKNRMMRIGCQCSTRELPPFHVWERNGLCQTIIRAPVCWYMFWRMLLRKEVIQPHLPVRLPCYDFVPIADPTFDGSLPEGLGHRLRVLPTFVT